MFVVLNFGGLLDLGGAQAVGHHAGPHRRQPRVHCFGIRILGLLHPLADAIKMLTKEDFMPARADRLLFELAPFVSVFFALVAFASIPFGDTLQSWAGRSRSRR